MSTITGTLETILNSAAVPLGKVEVALCGYGSRVPRINGQALVARITDDDVPVDSAGRFSFVVIGNDEIAPAATYYTVTIRDDNGDIVQVNAYRFISGQNYDLNLIDPYDPNLPPPPLPPIIYNLLLFVDGNTSVPSYPGDVYTAFKTVLAVDATASITGMVPGNLYTFIIVQDATGGHAFTWPSNVKNAAWVAHKPNATTIQTFIADEFGDLYAIGPGTYYP